MWIQVTDTEFEARKHYARAHAADARLQIDSNLQRKPVPVGRLNGRWAICLCSLSLGLPFYRQWKDDGRSVKNENNLFEQTLIHGRDGSLEYAKLREVTKGVIDWPPSYEVEGLQP
jgi:hypothetical protein